MVLLRVADSMAELGFAYPGVEFREFLPPPYEILELDDCQRVRFRVVKWTTGLMKIKPRWPGSPPEKVIRVLRIWVPREYKPYGTDYWDITSSTLIYQLLGILTRPDFMVYEVEVHAHGKAPAKRYEVSWRRLVPP